MLGSIGCENNSLLYDRVPNRRKPQSQIPYNRIPTGRISAYDIIIGGSYAKVVRGEREKARVCVKAA